MDVSMALLVEAKSVVRLRPSDQPKSAPSIRVLPHDAAFEVVIASVECVPEACPTA